jgi:hypothetical protein
MGIQLISSILMRVVTCLSFKISAILIDVPLTHFSLLSSTQLQKLMFWKHINDPLRVGGGVHECIIKQ